MDTIAGSADMGNKPNAICVLFGYLSGDRLLAQDKQYFMDTQWDEAFAYFQSLFNPTDLERYEPGKYQATIHPAWQSDGGVDYDRDTVLDRRIFVLKKHVTVEIIE